MKTHQEIRDAIEKVRTSYADSPKSQIAAVLDALNDRISELEDKQQADYRLLADEIQGSRHYNP